MLFKKPHLLPYNFNFFHSKQAHVRIVDVDTRSFSTKYDNQSFIDHEWTIRILVCYDICFFFNQILNNFKTMTIPACSMKMSITLSTLASISGRFSIRYFTIERWPFSCNKKRSLLKFVFASISAPFSLKYWRILSMVLAKWRGLHWYLSFASILLHVLIRYYTTGRWPFTHAIWRVVPSSHLSFASILVPFSIRY